MSDLISRANAIRWVKTECNPYGKPTLEFESGKRVIEHLEQMPSAEPNTKWIPCSERLPEIYTPVILSGKYNEVIGYRRNDSDWMALTGDGWETDIEHPEDFIAWMPLPKPYKGGDSE